MLLCLRYKATIFINKKTFSSDSYLIFSQENKWMIIHMIDIFTQNNFKEIRVHQRSIRLSSCFKPSTNPLVIQGSEKP